MTTDLTPQVEIVVPTGVNSPLRAAILERCNRDDFDGAVDLVLASYGIDLPRIMAEQFVMTCHLHALLMQIKPVVDDPSLILGSLPPGIRALIG